MMGMLFGYNSDYHVVEEMSPLQSWVLVISEQIYVTDLVHPR